MLSKEVLSQMHLRIEQDGIRVDDANRELAAAGIMYPVSTFARAGGVFPIHRRGMGQAA